MQRNFFLIWYMFFSFTTAMAQPVLEVEGTASYFTLLAEDSDETRMMVPLIDVIKALDPEGELGFDDELKRTGGKVNGKYFGAYLGSLEFEYGETKGLYHVQPRMYQNIMFVELGPTVQVLGGSVGWENQTKTATVFFAEPEKTAAEGRLLASESYEGLGRTVKRAVRKYAAPANELSGALLVYCAWKDHPENKGIHTEMVWEKVVLKFRDRQTALDGLRYIANEFVEHDNKCPLHSRTLDLKITSTQIPWQETVPFRDSLLKELDSILENTDFPDWPPK